MLIQLLGHLLPHLLFIRRLLVLPHLLLQLGLLRLDLVNVVKIRNADRANFAYKRIHCFELSLQFVHFQLLFLFFAFLLQGFDIRPLPKLSLLMVHRPLNPLALPTLIRQVPPHVPELVHGQGELLLLLVGEREIGLVGEDFNRINLRKQ